MRLIKSTPKGKQRVYDIEVADVHNFYANGVNVHNCATDDGVSVIKDDGTVVDLKRSSGSFTNTVQFTDNNSIMLVWGHTSDAIRHINHYSYADWQSDKNDYDQATGYNELPQFGVSALQSPLKTNATGIVGGVLLNLNGQNRMSAKWDDYGLKIADLNDSSRADGMVCHIRSDSNSGWMHGDIKGAFLSDTDATNANADTLNSVNTFDGTFATSTGWTTDSDWTISGGVASCSGADAGRFIYPTNDRWTDGSSVVVEVEVTAYTSGTLYVSYATGALTSGTDMSATGTYKFVNNVSGNELIYIRSESFVGSIDNVKIYYAEYDRSVNNKGLIPYGTVTKSAVATGAELVAYSGWDITSGDYLEQPYNSDLDFGTGDYYISVWVRQTYDQSSHSQNYVFNRVDRSGGSTNGARFELRVPTNTGYFRFYQNDGSNTSYSDSSTNSFPSAVWTHVVCGRNGSNLPIYINGEYNVSSLTGSANVQNSMTNTSAKLFMGGEHQDNNNPWGGDIALFRIGSGFPSPEQIKKIYEDEKVLFQENAACTLYGSSDAVTALAYDDSTSILYAGTSSGRSDFQGLRRINNTTTAVTTAMSASNGLVAEQ